MKTLQKIFRDPLGLLGLVVIFISLLLAIFVYWLIPDDTTNANTMHLSLAGKKPGFKVQMLLIPKETQKSVSAWEKLLNGAPARYESQPITTARKQGDTIYYRAYPANDGPEKILNCAAYGDQSSELSAWLEEHTYYLGTDRFGRDLLSRLALGARVSFLVGFVAVFISLLIGIPLGALAGYYGRWLDRLIMWFINVIWSVPGLLMVIAITLALGKGFWQVFVAIGLTMWVEVARVIRGQVISVVEKEYVQAAKVLGYSDLRIIFKHILPNVIAPLIVISAANFAAAILVESGLSFLGIGAQPPVPTWGNMIKDHYAYLIVDKAYLALLPGFAIMSLVLAFMFVGNALRDGLDVRLR